MERHVTVAQEFSPAHDVPQVSWLLWWWSQDSGTMYLRPFAVFFVFVCECPLRAFEHTQNQRRRTMSTYTQTPPGEVAPTLREINLELLALDLTSCTRCVGTLANVEKAIGTLQQVLQVTGFDVRVQKILIVSEAQARQYHFVTSPTLRINGQDIVFETLESTCDSCTDQCGCPEGTRCRVWCYQGLEYTEAPVGLIVEAILRAIYNSQTQLASTPVGYTGVPENLQRVFANRSARESTTAAACCAPAEQEVCCEPAAKSACCGTAETPTCGCQ